MPTYDYRCETCGAVFDAEASVDHAGEPRDCPVCGQASPRRIGSPKLLFKGDPAENRPYWHNHDGYSHSHAPRRGRHRTPSEDH